MNRGDTAPRAHFQFKQGSQVFPLTGLSSSAVVLHLFQQSTGVHKRGGGTMVFTDAPSGKVDYVWVPEDTNSPGVWEVWAEIITTDGPQSSINIETLEITNRTKGFNPKNWGGRLAVGLAPTGG